MKARTPTRELFIYKKGTEFEVVFYMDKPHPKENDDLTFYGMAKRLLGQRVNLQVTPFEMDIPTQDELEHKYYVYSAALRIFKSLQQKMVSPTLDEDVVETENLIAKQEAILQARDLEVMTKKQIETEKLSAEEEAMDLEQQRQAFIDNAHSQGFPKPTPIKPERKPETPCENKKTKVATSSKGFTILNATKYRLFKDGLTQEFLNQYTPKIGMAEAQRSHAAAGAKRKIEETVAEEKGNKRQKTTGKPFSMASLQKDEIVKMEVDVNPIHRISPFSL